MLRLSQLLAVLHQHAGFGVLPPLPLAPSSLQQLRSVKSVAKDDRSVKIVLLQDIFGFGKKGEVKTANPGWVRHKLFPRGAALYATPENVAKYAQDQSERTTPQDPDQAIEKEVLRMLRILSHKIVDISRKAAGSAAADATPAAAHAAGTPMPSPAGASASSPPLGSNGASPPQPVSVMQGSVTPHDIRQAVLRQTGVQLHETHLLLDKPITNFGTFKVPLNLRMLDNRQVELQVVVHQVKALRHGRASV